MELFHVRLANWIDQFYESRAEFARQVGIVPSMLNRWLNASTTPSLKHLQRMADIGVDIHWLLTGATQNRVAVTFVAPTDGDESNDQRRSSAKLKKALSDLRDAEAEVERQTKELTHLRDALRTCEQSLANATGQLEQANKVLGMLTPTR